MSLIKKILVIRFSSFGDIILSFPLLKKLREKFPGSEMHFLTKKNYAEIVSLNRDVNKVIYPDGSLAETRKAIGNENYDLIIDIHKNFRSLFISAFNAKKIRRYYKENFKKFLLVNIKLNFFREIIPVYKKYLLSINEFLNDDDLDFTISELNFGKDRILEEDYIVISPASRHFTKTYPAEKFIEFIIGLKDKRVILVGDNSTNDKKICDYIESKCKNILNLCGKLDMNELANVIYYSDYVICNDSAIMHLSEALGKRVVALFGSTVKEFGFFPQLMESKVFEVDNLKCIPCTHIGRESCPKGHFRCMEEIQLIIDN
ncbi:MAG: glycosyltransferase family 9 protein [Ignavibacteria bacterium]|nr:glycosyltransferase family 9 protein [Ignavibacteria bacterium]